MPRAEQGWGWRTWSARLGTRSGAEVRGRGHAVCATTANAVVALHPGKVRDRLGYILK